MLLSGGKENIKYYEIDEQAARRAKEANSFSDYVPGSATAEYRAMVDKAYDLGESKKQCVDPMFHDKVDSLVDRYARKLAENLNERNNIDARVPSVMIAGPSNFPVRAKEKQNAARDRNMNDYNMIQGLLEKVESIGLGGISADDPGAIKKLEARIASLEANQDFMKKVNAYYRKNGTCIGAPGLDDTTAKTIEADMKLTPWHSSPYPSYALSNNNANIRRLKDRLKVLERNQEVGFAGWQFEGGRVEANQEANRLQIFFDDKPDADKRATLKSRGFRWAPSAGVWQRQLNGNAIYAADRIDFIQPVTGERPSQLQPKRAPQAKEDHEPVR